MPGFTASGKFNMGKTFEPKKNNGKNVFFKYLEKVKTSKNNTANTGPPRGWEELNKAVKLTRRPKSARTVTRSGHLVERPRSPRPAFINFNVYPNSPPKSPERYANAKNANKFIENKKKLYRIILTDFLFSKLPKLNVNKLNTNDKFIAYLSKFIKANVWKSI